MAELVELDEDGEVKIVAPRTAARRRRRRMPGWPDGDYRHDYHDPGTGRFAPVGYVTPRKLWGLLETNEDKRKAVSKEVRDKLRSDPDALLAYAQAMRDGDRDRLKLLAQKLRRSAIGDRPKLDPDDPNSRKNRNAWDAGSRTVANMLPTLASNATPRDRKESDGVPEGFGIPEERKPGKWYPMSDKIDGDGRSIKYNEDGSYHVRGTDFRGNRIDYEVDADGKRHELIGGRRFSDVVGEMGEMGAPAGDGKPEPHIPFGKRRGKDDVQIDPDTGKEIPKNEPDAKNIDLESMWNFEFEHDGKRYTVEAQIEPPQRGKTFAITGKIKDGSGEKVGEFLRSWDPDSPGALYFDFFSVSKEHQGGGVGSAFVTETMRRAKAQGINRVHTDGLSSGSYTGAYAWARQGYDWAPSYGDESARKLLGHMQMIREDPFYERLDPEVRSELEAMMDRLQAARASGEMGLGKRYLPEDFPTPHEIAMIGHGKAMPKELVYPDREQVDDWLGKAILQGRAGDGGSLSLRYELGLERIPDTGEAPNVPDADGPDVDLSTIEGRGKKPVRWPRMRTNYDTGEMEQDGWEEGTLSPSTIKARQKAIRKVMEDEFPQLKGRDFDIIIDTDWDTYHARGIPNSPLAAWRDEHPGHPNGLVILSPSFGHSIADDNTRDWQVLMHELTHAASPQPENGNVGLQVHFEEAMAEILSHDIAHRRLADFGRLTDRHGKPAEDSLAEQVKYGSYKHHVAEVIMHSAERVGWDREAIMADLRRQWDAGQWENGHSKDVPTRRFEFHPDVEEPEVTIQRELDKLDEQYDGLIENHPQHADLYNAERERLKDAARERLKDGKLERGFHQNWEQAKRDAQAAGINLDRPGTGLDINPDDETIPGETPPAVLAEREKVGGALLHWLLGGEVDAPVAPETPEVDTTPDVDVTPGGMVDMTPDDLARRAKDAGGPVRMRVSDNRMSRVGIQKGDVLEVEYKDDEYATIYVPNMKGDLTKYDVQWKRFDGLEGAPSGPDTDTDVPDAPDVPDVPETPSVDEQALAAIDADIDAIELNDLSPTRTIERLDEKIGLLEQRLELLPESDDRWGQTVSQIGALRDWRDGIEVEDDVTYFDPDQLEIIDTRDLPGKPSDYGSEDYGYVLRDKETGRLIVDSEGNPVYRFGPASIRRARLDPQPDWKLADPEVETDADKPLLERTDLDPESLEGKVAAALADLKLDDNLFAADPDADVTAPEYSSTAPHRLLIADAIDRLMTHNKSARAGGEGQNRYIYVSQPGDDDYYSFPPMAAKEVEALASQYLTEDADVRELSNKMFRAVMNGEDIEGLETVAAWSRGATPEARQDLWYRTGGSFRKERRGFTSGANRQEFQDEFAKWMRGSSRRKQFDGQYIWDDNPEDGQSHVRDLSPRGKANRGMFRIVDEESMSADDKVELVEKKIKPRMIVQAMDQALTELDGTGAFDIDSVSQRISEIVSEKVGADVKLDGRTVFGWDSSDTSSLAGVFRQGTHYVDQTPVYDGPAHPEIDLSDTDTTQLEGIIDAGRHILRAFHGGNDRVEFTEPTQADLDNQLAELSDYRELLVAPHTARHTSLQKVVKGIVAESALVRERHGVGEGVEQFALMDQVNFDPVQNFGAMQLGPDGIEERAWDKIHFDIDGYGYTVHYSATEDGYFLVANMGPGGDDPGFGKSEKLGDTAEAAFAQKMPDDVARFRTEAILHNNNADAIRQMQDGTFDRVTGELIEHLNDTDLGPGLGKLTGWTYRPPDSDFPEGGFVTQHPTDKGPTGEPIELLATFVLGNRLKLYSRDSSQDRWGQSNFGIDYTMARDNYSEAGHQLRGLDRGKYSRVVGYQRKQVTALADGPRDTRSREERLGELLGGLYERADGAEVGEVAGFDDATNQEQRELLNRVASLLPKELVEEAGPLGRMVSSPEAIARGAPDFYGDNRAWYNQHGIKGDGVATIALERNGLNASTMLHEFGHHLEKDDAFGRAMWAFLVHRTGGERVSTDDLGYGTGEKSREDKFYSMYAGKVYSKMERTAMQSQGAEVWTMGLEGVFRLDGSGSRAEQMDDEYTAYILGMLALASKRRRRRRSIADTPAVEEATPAAAPSTDVDAPVEEAVDVAVPEGGAVVAGLTVLTPDGEILLV